MLQRGHSTSTDVGKHHITNLGPEGGGWVYWNHWLKLRFPVQRVHVTRTQPLKVLRVCELCFCLHLTLKAAL